MSAMHWEARRRQSSLDNRMARLKLQQQQQKDSETSSSEPATNTTQEQTVGAQCPHCSGDLKTPLHQSAKIPNRYSSSQYSQQW